MDKIELKAAHRETLGKKVRHLRRQNITPAHLFGHNVSSVSLQCDTMELKHALAMAGTTALISLKLDTARRPRSVLVKEVQREPRTGALLHVDFYQVKTTEKLKVQVPVVLVGEAPALRFKENMLIQDIDSIDVECFPDKIPPSFEVDVSSLTEADQSIRVKDLVVPEGVTLAHEDPEFIVAKISVAPAARMEEEEVVEEAVEVAEEAEAPAAETEE